MNEYPIIERNHQRVLTTAQLAEAYETDSKVISNNFNRNKQRYEEGRHYYCLSGEEKREFLSLNGIEDGLNAGTFYLWTEKGALLLAKSLNSDKAWDVYDRLVEDYYRCAAIQMQDSYMIADPVKRAERWIEEYKEKKALELTVAAQQETIEEQTETIAVQTEQIAEQTETIEVMTPKAEYYDMVLNNPEAISISVIAADYGKTAIWFNKKLSELKIQYKLSGMWTLYSQYQNMGYTCTKTVPCAGKTNKVQTYWTQKGRMFLYEKLKEHGILPVMEQNQGE